MEQHGARLVNIWGLLIGALALLAAIGVIACTHFSPRATPSNTIHTSAQAQSTPSQNASPTPDGSSSSGAPPAAPLYTPSQQVSSTGGSATYTSSSPSYTVINFYGEYLSTNGWKITSETTLNGTTTIHAQNNGQTVSVAISDAANNGTTFTITAS